MQKMVEGFRAAELHEGDAARKKKEKNYKGVYENCQRKIISPYFTSE